MQFFIYLQQYLLSCWGTLVEMAPYISLGFFMAGVLHILVNPRTISRYLGMGRVKSVLYATLLGIPLPLCSCGVLPTATALKKQGANDGATMAFMIATPETGVDSIAVTYALLDPVMTIFRPISAFITAFTAGVAQNILGDTYRPEHTEIRPDLSCKVDNCCDGVNCPPDEHRRHHTGKEKFYAAIRYGFGEILDDIAKWLIVGIAIAGAIHVMIPENFLKSYLHGGLFSMVLMLVVGIPFYICATASTPIAAALILKGVSPGAALVFLLAGPATNAATLSVVYGLFKRRATVIYLSSIALCSIVMGLLLDKIYIWGKISPQSIAGHAAELLPEWVSSATALVLLGLIVRSFWKTWQRRAPSGGDNCGSSSCSCSHHHD